MKRKRISLKFLVLMLMFLLPVFALSGCGGGGSSSSPTPSSSSGNVWVANYGNGTAGTASADSNVTELSSAGALIGTYAAGSYPYWIAIDSSGNNGPEYFPYKGPEWP